MIVNKIKKIQKREGNIVSFDQNKITNVILKAGQAVKEFDKIQAKDISDQVVKMLNIIYGGRKKPPRVEEIQDVVEIVLMKRGFSVSAKAYIIYRQEHQKIRMAKYNILSGKDTKIHLSLNSLKVMANRYLSKDPKTGKVIETPEEMFSRVASALAMVEKKYKVPLEKIHQYSKDFYNVMYNFEFLPAGRTLTNAGTKLKVVSNCIVLHIEDSMEGIFNTLKDAALLQQAGSGIGFPFHMLRPSGSQAKRTSGMASGPVSFLKVYNEAFGVIKQQGRHGANIAVMRVDHPDILDFINVKSVEGELKNFNISVAVTDEFMKQVEQRSKKSWICQFNGKKMKPRRIRRDDHGIILETKEVEISAIDIMNEIVKAAWSNGEPGIIFIDEVNRTNPLPGLGRIEACNPCVTGDTWVMTANGPIKVVDLLSRKFKAVVDGKVWAANKGFFMTGKKRVYSLKTKEGHELRLTKDHRVRKAGDSLEWIEAGKLKPGDKIMLHNHSKFSWNGKHNGKEGYVMGLFLGDGTINLSKNGASIILSSWGDTRGPSSVRDYIFNFTKSLPHRSDFKGWSHIQDRNEYRLSLVSIDKIAENLGIKTKKLITKKMEEASSDFCYGLLRGLFDADGSVQGSQIKGVSVRLAQSNSELLRAVQRILLRLGVASKIYFNRRSGGKRKLPDGKGGIKEYPVKPQHELIISKQNLKSFYQRIGFTDVEKMEKLEKALNSYKRNLNKENFSVKVQEICFDGVEEVYDVRIPGINAFDANGLYVHNCGEQMLHDSDICNLGSINLDKFVKNGNINWNRLKHVARTASRMLDNVIDITEFPINRINKVFRNNRRLGLGIMGFADMLFQLRVPYNSEQGRNIAAKVMKFIRSEAFLMSQELAEEKGVFKNYNMSIYKKKGIKVRNAALTTIAPTGTISMLTEVSSGLEPYFALAYIKEVMGGQKFYYTNRYLEEELRNHEVYTEKLAMEIAKKGSIQTIKGIPDSIKKIFVGALDIKVEDHIKMQAAFQKYVDNSISKTINFPNNSPQSDVLNAYILAWRLKCKSCTVYRTSSRKTEVLSLATKKGDNISSPVLEFIKPSSNSCPECRGELVFQEGCVSCPQCGFGLCSL